LSYWDEIDQHISEAQQDASDEALPDPWAHRSSTPPSLTGDQLAFLSALADQPGAPRLDDGRPRGLPGTDHPGPAPGPPPDPGPDQADPGDVTS